MLFVYEVVAVSFVSHECAIVLLSHLAEERSEVVVRIEQPENKRRLLNSQAPSKGAAGYWPTPARRNSAGRHAARSLVYVGACPVRNETRG